MDATASAADRPAPEPAPPLAAGPGVATLFGAFLGVGLMGFGGVLPLARRMIVEQRGWLTPAEFSDLLALCQFLPGGNIINLSVAIGLRFRGLAGAVAAITGLLAMPTVIAIAMGSLYERYAGVPVVRHLFMGLAAAAAGLIVAMSAKIAAPLLTAAGRNVWRIAIAALCFGAVVVLRLPLLPTMLVLAPASIFCAWRFLPRPGTGA
jgi:chromate transporter